METVFDKVFKNLELIDFFVFNNQKTKITEVSGNFYSTDSVNLAAAYNIKTDSYSIHSRLKNLNKETFVNEFSVIRSDRVLNTILPCYLNEKQELHEMPEFSELPKKSFKHTVAALCAHEVRHRNQFVRNLNESIFHNYEILQEFKLFYNFNNYYIEKLISTGAYPTEHYHLELDAMMIEEIFLYELWLAEENGMTFDQAIEQASKIISMSTEELRDRLYQFCYLGTSYFK